MILMSTLVPEELSFISLLHLFLRSKDYCERMNGEITVVLPIFCLLPAHW